MEISGEDLLLGLYKMQKEAEKAIFPRVIGEE